MNLEKLKKFQEILSKKVTLYDRINPKDIKLVGGIDLTYTNIWENPTIGISCIVIYDVEKREIVETVFATGKVYFPYIPTFLAFRELPLIKKAFKKLKKTPDAFMLDGMGIMHPRGMGIAAHFGVEFDVVSVGVAKSYLIGNYTEPPNEKLSSTPVLIEGKLIGYALRTKRNAKPIFVSPGHNISIESALKVTISCLSKYKIPEPTRLAHNKLQEFRKSLLNNYG